MPKHPVYQDKICQWDFRPEGETSSTRKGWRVYAYVPDHNAPEPILATAFICLDKKNAPKNDYVTYLAKALKKFLATTVDIVAAEDQFIDRIDGQGQTVATCDRCWEIVVISDDPDEVEINKGVHRQNCSGHPPE